MALKHVGRLAKTQRKVIVAYRVIPGDPDHCLVVQTQSLDADQHDALIKLVESNGGQNSYELAEAMARTILPDGRNMLAAFHKFGKLEKVPTNAVEMTPDSKSAVNLRELNEIIAQQKGVTVADLAIGPKTTTPVEQPVTTEQITEQYTSTSSDILTDEKLAAQYRSQADALYKEAKRLREEAEKLSPTKKKAKASAEEVQ